MSISKEEVAHVAGLARLRLSDEQTELFTGQLNDILGHVAMLNQLDTQGVAPTSHAAAPARALRPDEVRPSQDRAQTLANAPAEDGESFVVPRVI